MSRSDSLSRRCLAGIPPTITLAYDRTLATLWQRPFVVGLDINATQVLTIFPQRHDVRDEIVTESGIKFEANRLFC